MVLVPVVGVVVLAALVVVPRVRQAQSARMIAAEASGLRRLDTVQVALLGEEYPSEALIGARALRAPEAALSAVLGEPAQSAIAAARRRTDAALGSLDALPSDRALASALRRELARYRAVVDDSSGTLQESTVETDRMDRRLAAAAGELADRALTEAETSARSGTLTQAIQAASVADKVLLLGVEESAAMADMFYTSPGSVNLAAQVDRLAEAQGAYQQEVAGLAEVLPEPLVRRWAKFEASPANRIVANAIARSVASGIPVPVALAVSPVFGKAEIARDQGLLSVARAALTDALQAASDVAASAEGRTEGTLLGAGLIVLCTAVLLVAVGASIRRPLAQLAEVARRISDGDLTEPAVRGVPEVERVGRALAEAVQALQRVQGQADAIAAGALDAPILAEPVAGPLGASMHESVAKVAASIRERDQLRAELAFQAAHDALTALPNRASATEQLRAGMARCQRDGRGLAVLFVDVDHFKRVNDTAGHAAGDRVLVEAARRMRSSVRQGDVVCRLGGDEFLVIMESVADEASAEAVGRRLVEALSEPIDIGGRTVSVSASVGVALSLDGGVDADRLLREADEALYRAKRAGRGRVERMDDRGRSVLRELDDVETALPGALERGELVLHYQPIVSLSDGAVEGFEGLMRWQRPDGSIVGPDTFIPVAERSGLIWAMGRWALEEAASRLVRWGANSSRLRTAYVAVNTSARQLASPQIVEVVSDALERTGLEPGRLVLEVTETLMMSEQWAVPHLSAIRELGVKVALDDFGTGYSSLGRFLALPVDLLKIDRSFVSGIGEDDGGRSTKLVELMIEVARTARVGVVAEGVEQPEQCGRLRQMACSSAQGYLFARPMPPELVPAWVDQHWSAKDLARS